jgi:hypothetical protein
MESTPEQNKATFHLVVTDMLVKERLGVLVDQSLARNHAGGLAKVASNPSAA